MLLLLPLLLSTLLLRLLLLLLPLLQMPYLSLPRGRPRPWCGNVPLGWQLWCPKQGHGKWLFAITLGPLLLNTHNRAVTLLSGGSFSLILLSEICELPSFVAEGSRQTSSHLPLRLGGL